VSTSLIASLAPERASSSRQGLADTRTGAGDHRDLSGEPLHEHAPCQLTPVEARRYAGYGLHKPESLAGLVASSGVLRVSEKYDARDNRLYAAKHGSRLRSSVGV
jgi:hypothetical protein